MTRCCSGDLWRSENNVVGKRVGRTGNSVSPRSYQCGMIGWAQSEAADRPPGSERFLADAGW